PFDHVHPDSTAGQVGDFVGGGKARLENQPVDLPVRQFVLLADQAPLHGFFADAVPLQAAAVIGDFNDDAAGVVVGIETDRALGGFALLQPGLDIFQAVVDTVAYQVHQRVADTLHQGFVQLRFATTDLQAYIFAQFPAHIQDHPLEPVEGLADLDHAQAQRRIPDAIHQSFSSRLGFLCVSIVPFVCL